MILLSFDINDSRHFLKNKLAIRNEKLVEVITDNTESLLRTLEPFEVSVTFFISSKLVTSFEKLIELFYKRGHEIALFHHGDWSQTAKAREDVNRIIGKSVKGIRVKGDFSTAEIRNQQFVYVSPVDNLKVSHLFRKISGKTEVYSENELEVIPQSFAPYSQLPYNETVFQYLPMKYYENMVFETLKSSEYVLIYLNMLQFTDFEQYQFKIPFYKKYNTGRKMEDKLNRLLQWINDNDMATSTMKDYII